jgi:hypothetical protein
VILLLAWLAGAQAFAHSLGESYLFLRIRNDGFTGRFQATVQDLDLEIGLDADRDGKVSTAEVEGSIPRIRALFLEGFRAGHGQTAYPIDCTGHGTLDLPIGRYVEIAFRSDNTGILPDVLWLEYRLFFESDPDHRALLVVEENERTGFASAAEEVFLVFSPDEWRQELELAAVRARSAFLRFLALGVHHIAIGVDHILFLVALVLPSVLVRRDARWLPTPGFRPALIFVVGVVTLFTVAHSVTLSAAAFRVIELPPRLVESVIALSVALAAVNNFFPMVRERTWLVVFGFGLFHGLGFASVLGHLVFNRSSLLVPLLGFNFGVELGQLAIILLVFPLLYLMRRQKFYVPWVVRGGSSIIAVIAIVWLVQRAFGI